MVVHSWSTNGKCWKLNITDRMCRGCYSSYDWIFLPLMVQCPRPEIKQLKNNTQPFLGVRFTYKDDKQYIFRAFVLFGIHEHLSTGWTFMFLMFLKLFFSRHGLYFGFLREVPKSTMTWLCISAKHYFQTASVSKINYLCINLHVPFFLHFHNQLNEIKDSLINYICKHSIVM